MSERAGVDELRALPLFAALDEGALEELARRLTVRSFDAGAVVFDEGEPGSTIHAVVSGSVELRRRSTNGRELVVAARGAGEWFGEVGLIAVKRRGVSARAREASRLLEIPARELHELSRRDMRAYALLTMNLARELARKLDRLEQALVDELDRT